MSRLRKVTVGVCSVALAIGVAGCGGAEDEPSPVASTGAGGASAAARYTTPLDGICPDTVVVQTSWWPEVDYGPTYQLLGPDPTIDEDNFLVSGPLGATGVTLEIRSGGPAVGFEPVSSLFELDDEILLGYLDLDEAIRNSADHPTVAVLAPYAKSPLMFFWGDPAYDFESLADIGQSDATVLTPDEAFVDVLVGEGLLTQSQIDTSYTGDVNRFVAEDGKIVQAGFVTDEVYRLEHEVAQWAKPVHYELLGDAYPAYSNVLAVRKDKLEANSECLSKLVPLFQQGVRDYLADPAPVNQLMIDVTESLDTAGYDLSVGLLEDGNTKQRELGLVDNGPDGAIGSFDTARIEELIRRLTPALTAAGTSPSPDIAATDLVTSEFIDPSISLD